MGVLVPRKLGGSKFGGKLAPDPLNQPRFSSKMSSRTSAVLKAVSGIAAEDSLYDDLEDPFFPVNLDSDQVRLGVRC